ncbi:hypothetical protein ACFW04_013930 [Cataglyphis niger]
MGGKIIHANKSSSANLKKHINKKRKRVLLKRLNEDMFDNKQKQQKLERWDSKKLAVTQKTLNKAILLFIIFYLLSEDLQPLSIVDSPTFIDLVKNGLPSSIRIISRKIIKEKLQETFCAMTTALKNKLVDVEVVSTTADLWSKKKRSYLGITVHWIDSTTLRRESAALTSETINSIFLEYHIQKFAIQRLTNFNLNELLITNEEENLIDTEDVITLLAHHRCVNHLLNLIAIKDSEKYRAVFANFATKLWNKQNQSTQVVDIIKEIYHVYLKTPYMGYLLSILNTLEEKLEKLNMQRLTECHSLLIAIQQRLHKRFYTLHQKKKLILAASLHPKFKLNWLTGDKKELLQIICKKKELQEFLKSNNCNAEMLNNYLKLKNAFIKYNTPLPISASVEQLFSCRGLYHKDVILIMTQWNNNLF